MARAGGPDADSSITTTTHPLPLTARERAIIATASAFFAVLLITIAFAFVPASFVSFLVKEREVNAKHQQLISGVSILAYVTCRRAVVTVARTRDVPALGCGGDALASTLALSSL